VLSLLICTRRVSSLAKKKKRKNRNPVSKNLHKFNKPKVFIDRKKEGKKHPKEVDDYE